MKRTECPRCGNYNGHVVATQPHWQLVKCETCSFLDWRSTREVAQVPVPDPAFDNDQKRWDVRIGSKINPEVLRLEIISLHDNQYHLKVYMRRYGNQLYSLWCYFPNEKVSGYTFLDELFQEFWEWLFKWHKVSW